MLICFGYWQAICYYALRDSVHHMEKGMNHNYSWWFGGWIKCWHQKWSAWHAAAVVRSVRKKCTSKIWGQTVSNTWDITHIRAQCTINAQSAIRTWMSIRWICWNCYRERTTKPMLSGKASIQCFCGDCRFSLAVAAYDQRRIIGITRYISKNFSRIYSIFDLVDPVASLTHEQDDGRWVWSIKVLIKESKTLWTICVIL